MIHKSFYFASQKSFFKKQISSENKGSYFLKETILTTLAHHNPCLGKKKALILFSFLQIYVKSCTVERCPFQASETTSLVFKKVRTWSFKGLNVKSGSRRSWRRVVWIIIKINCMPVSNSQK